MQSRTDYSFAFARRLGWHWVWSHITAAHLTTLRYHGHRWLGLQLQGEAHELKAGYDAELITCRKNCRKFCKALSILCRTWQNFACRTFAQNALQNPCITFCKSSARVLQGSAELLCSISIIQGCREQRQAMGSRTRIQFQ